MNIQGQSQKYGHLIVAGGTIIALIGFFFLPYVTASSTAASSSSSSSSTLTWSAIQAASIQGFIWLEALLAVGILLVALLLAYSRNPFGMSQVALDKQVQRGIYTIIGISVVSLLLQYVLMTTIPGTLVGMFSTNAPGSTIPSSSSVAMGYNTGSWFYLVGMLAVIGGAIYALRAVRPAYAAQGQSSSYIPPTQYSQMNQQNQQMPWQPPAQAQPPQSSWQAPQEQYPPTQQPQQPQPPTEYPPTQRAWPQQPPQQPQQQQPPYPPSFPGQ